MSANFILSFFVSFFLVYVSRGIARLSAAPFYLKLINSKFFNSVAFDQELVIFNQNQDNPKS
jgi:hypothetical protein